MREARREREVRREREDERESSERESGRSSKFIVQKTFNLTIAVSFKYQHLPSLQSDPPTSPHRNLPFDDSNHRKKKE